MVSVNVPQEATDLMENFDPSSLEGVDFGLGGIVDDTTGVETETETSRDTRKGFAEAVLRGLAEGNEERLKQSGNWDKTVNALVAWMGKENTDAMNNPMATTLDYGENTWFNTFGPNDDLHVRNYADFETGVAATIQTLLYPGRYTNIVDALTSEEGIDAQTLGTGSEYSDELTTWGTKTFTPAMAHPNQPLGPGGSPATSALSPEEGGEPLDFFLDQYGGYGLLLGDENDPRFQIGVIRDASGKIIRTVPASSTEATDFVNIIDYITDTGITNESRVLGLLQKTDWWAETDQAARDFDVKWAEYSDPQKIEYLEPLMDKMRKKADQLGFAYDDFENLTPSQILETDLAKKASQIMRLGDSEDEEFLNKWVLQDSKQATITSEATEFGASKDSIATKADSYFLTISDDELTELTEQVFTGELTDLELGQMFKNRSVGMFPSLSNVITEMGITPKQYFSQHIAEIETLLERPVDFKREFLDIVEHVDENGNVRPKTLSETRKRVRKTSEWQNTKNAENEARNVAAVIGEVFGKVAY